MTTAIRPTTDRDLPVLLALHREAFGPDEGPEIEALVAALLDDPTAQPVLSLVAERDGSPVGHILFTAVEIDPDGAETAARILAPLAVVPAAQGTGVGGALIRDGLGRLREAGVHLVFVLGDPGYYGRFGFHPAGAQGLHAPYPVPPPYADAWMVQELHPGHLGRVRGTVRCCRALDDPRHWVE